MTLQITLSEETEARLRERAAAAGQEVAVFAAEILARAAEPPLTMEEISGPIADDFAASGMTEEELGQFLENVKHEVRKQRRATQ